MQDIIANRETLTITREKWRDPFSGWRWQSHIRSWRMLFTFRKRRPEHWLVLRAGNFPDLLRAGAQVCARMDSKPNLGSAKSSANDVEDGPEAWAGQVISKMGFDEPVPAVSAQGFFDGAEGATRVASDDAAIGQPRKAWISAWRGGVTVAGVCPFEELHLLEQMADGDPIAGALLDRLAKKLTHNDEDIRIDVKNRGELTLHPDRAGIVCTLEDGHLRVTVPTSVQTGAAALVLDVAAQITEATDVAEAMGLHEFHLPTDALDAFVAGPPPARAGEPNADELLDQLRNSIKDSAQRDRLFFWPEEPRFLSADFR